MAYNNGIVTAPVSVYDVQRALSNTSPDVKTLCLADNVNKWSKCKPVEPRPSVPVVKPLVLPGPGIPAQDTFKTLDGNWGVGVFDDDNLPVSGLIPMSALTQYGSDSYQQVAGLNAHYQWKHIKPSTVGRLTDFANYNHNAIPFIYTNWQQNIELYSQQRIIDFYIPFLATENDKSLTFEDMAGWSFGGVSLGDMYLCAVWNGTGNIEDVEPMGEAFSAESIAECVGTDGIDMHIPIEADDLASGNTWDLYFCLVAFASGAQHTWSNVVGFLPLPTGNMLYDHIQIKAHLQSIFATMTLVGIGAVRGLGSQSLNTFDFRQESASYWSTLLAAPSSYDVYGQETPRTCVAPDGNGVVLKLTAVVGSVNVPNISAALVTLRLNTGTSISAVAQIIGPNSNCQDHPSTNVNTFTLAAGQTYTFYVAALDVVADAINEVQLSMSVSGHVQEGMQAATPWMNVHTS